MERTERARTLDTLRKRRSRKKARALNEGKPEDFYITQEDFIDEQFTPLRTATPRARTPRQGQTAAVEADEQVNGWLLLGASGVIIGGLLSMPYWLPRLFK